MSQTTQNVLPKETLDRMAVIFGDAQQKFLDLEARKAEVILAIAKELEKLKGIIKERIASLISRRFRRLGFPVDQSLIYKSLGPEYKATPKRIIQTEEMKQRKEEGFDPVIGDFVTVESFIENVDEEIIGSYGRRTKERLLYDLGLELRELKKQNKQLREEVQILRIENSKLKKRIK